MEIRECEWVLVENPISGFLINYPSCCEQELAFDEQLVGLPEASNRASWSDDPIRIPNLALIANNAFKADLSFWGLQLLSNKHLAWQTNNIWTFDTWKEAYLASNDEDESDDDDDSR